MPCTDHNHTVPKFTPTTAENNLLQYIDVANVKVLNSVVRPNGKSVEDFLNLSLPGYQNDVKLESDCDNQILIIVPFLTTVSLFSILLQTSDSDGTLKHMDLFANLNNSFDNFNSINRRAPDQSTELTTGLLQEYPLDRFKLFKNCNSLHIFFPDNMEDDEDLLTRISYLEIRGEPVKSMSSSGLDTTLANKVFLKDSQFESLGNPRDHKKFEANNTSIMEI